jgi:hypothetical protein
VPGPEFLQGGKQSGSQARSENAVRASGPLGSRGRHEQTVANSSRASVNQHQADPPRRRVARDFARWPETNGYPAITGGSGAEETTERDNWSVQDWENWIHKAYPDMEEDRVKSWAKNSPGEWRRLQEGARRLDKLHEERQKRRKSNPK